MESIQRRIWSLCWRSMNSVDHQWASANCVAMLAMAKTEFSAPQACSLLTTPSPLSSGHRSEVVASAPLYPRMLDVPDCYLSGTFDVFGILQPQCLFRLGGYWRLSMMLISCARDYLKVILESSSDIARNRCKFHPGGPRVQPSEESKGLTFL